MAVPTYDKFIEPLIRYLATKPDGVPARDAHNTLTDALKLTDEDRAELLPSGAQSIYKNRAGWAHDRLKRAGLSQSLRRGYWQLTKEGVAFAKAHPSPWSMELVDQVANGNEDVHLRKDNLTAKPENVLGAPPDNITVSPDDRLGTALKELRAKARVDLLEALAHVTPRYFEKIVLELLHAMGYGISREDLRRVGRSGDGGIDGIISLDRLGLDKVYIQAKRWQNSVGRPDVQGFYGALAGQQAKRGVFITTSNFSQQAIDFAKSVEGIVLVDGDKLADLMIDHEVGIKVQAVKVPRLDSEYFDE
jgi:restriction system protein